MYSFKFLVFIAAVLVLFFAPGNEVTAAPAPEPHPCLWMLDHDKHHPEPTTTTSTITAKPDVVENFARLKDKKTKQLGKLINDWIMWGPSNEGQKLHSKNMNRVDRMISDYMKFLANILNNMFQ